MPTTSRIIATLGLSLTAYAAVLAPQAVAQPLSDSDWNWATVTHAGNAPVNPSDYPYNPSLPSGYAPFPDWGSVNHEYRISKTETTASQWLPFVRAYAPYLTTSGAPPEFTGGGAIRPFGAANNPSSYSIQPGFENDAIDTNFRFAAMYCNWLQNNQRSDADAFLTGAYDLRNIPVDDYGTWLTIPTRNPEAKYWIPSMNEWVKAAFFDPARYGTGQAGYWLYPNASDQPLVPGMPATGGQTQYGMPSTAPDAGLLPVGAYPNVQSPWGLVDVSGGVAELTDTAFLTDGFADVFVRPSKSFGPGVDIGSDYDNLGYYNSRWANLYGGFGFRLASSVPAPSALIPLSFVFFVKRRRRRETCCERSPCSSSPSWE